MSIQFTPDEQAFRALALHRLADAMRPCLDEAVGRNIRERAAWMIVSGEMIKLASRMQSSWDRQRKSSAPFARDCFQ
jgi:hypothetical protein